MNATRLLTSREAQVKAYKLLTIDVACGVFCLLKGWSLVPGDLLSLSYDISHSSLFLLRPFFIKPDAFTLEIDGVSSFSDALSENELDGSLLGFEDCRTNISSRGSGSSDVRSIVVAFFGIIAGVLLILLATAGVRFLQAGVSAHSHQISKLWQWNAEADKYHKDSVHYPFLYF